jgi:hypothetical protein
VAKAVTFHEMPIYRFDLACLFELLGERDIAMECFREFLSASDRFVSTVVDRSTVKRRNVPLAIAIAKRKLG